MNTPQMNSTTCDTRLPSWFAWYIVMLMITASRILYTIDHETQTIYFDDGTSTPRLAWFYYVYYVDTSEAWNNRLEIDWVSCRLKWLMFAVVWTIFITAHVQMIFFMLGLCIDGIYIICIMWMFTLFVFVLGVYVIDVLCCLIDIFEFEFDQKRYEAACEKLSKRRDAVSKV